LRGSYEGNDRNLHHFKSADPVEAATSATRPLRTFQRNNILASFARDD
jgi:hypothetical protein